MWRIPIPKFISRLRKEPEHTQNEKSEFKPGWNRGYFPGQEFSKLNFVFPTGKERNGFDRIELKTYGNDMRGFAARGTRTVPVPLEDDETKSKWVERPVCFTLSDQGFGMINSTGRNLRKLEPGEIGEFEEAIKEALESHPNRQKYLRIFEKMKSKALN